MIGLILAHNRKNVIARPNGTLPWKCRNDMQNFVAVSKMYGNIVMGRKTFDVCGPLKDRVNYVLTRDPHYGSRNSSIRVINSIDQLDCDPLLVIGGPDVYRQFLTRMAVDEIYRTIIDDDSDGIKFDIEQYLHDFELTTVRPYPDCRILTYERQPRYLGV